MTHRNTPAVRACIAILTASLVGCAGWLPSSNDPADDGADSRSDIQANAANPALLKAASNLFSTPAIGVPWAPVFFPGKRYVSFEPVHVDGRAALRVKANSSVSILRQKFEPALGSVARVSFSWRVDGVPVDADLAVSNKADSPVRVLLAFDGDRDKWAPRNHRLSEMSRLLTGEELPYASLVYVWSAKEAPGTVVVNPRTDRIRKVVLDSGTTHVGEWRDHVRDIRADFRLAFGEEPGPLRLVAVMTDTDNTGSALTAWYGSLKLTAAAD